MNLTEHFTLAEFTDSQTAVRRGISNIPNEKALDNLRRVAEVLEQVRTLVGKPLNISSGYRSPALNLAVGGAQASAHLSGLAADITVSGMTPIDLARAIEGSGIKFDQLIYEGTWVHIGLADGELRNEVLTAHFGHGGALYTRGIS
jgi:hypothetical protein